MPPRTRAATRPMTTTRACAGGSGAATGATRRECWVVLWVVDMVLPFRRRCCRESARAERADGGDRAAGEPGDDGLVRGVPAARGHVGRAGGGVEGQRTRSVAAGRAPGEVRRARGELPGEV